MAAATTDKPQHPWEDAFRRQMLSARESRGMTQYELAKRAVARGLSFYQVTIQRLEAGERPVKLNEAVILAGILDIDLADIVSAGSERERLLAFFRGTLEAQSEDYRAIATHTNDLTVKQSLAEARLREAHSTADWDGEDKELIGEVEQWLTTKMPADAFVEGLLRASPAHGPRGQLVVGELLKALLDALAFSGPGDGGLRLEDVGADPQALTIVRLHDVIRGATAYLDALIGERDDAELLTRSASAERAVEAGHQLADRVGAGGGRNHGERVEEG